MSRVGSSGTKPEWILRCGLHRLGFRYRLGGGQLPGRPDLVFPKYRAVVFVHGCFWHRHSGCRDASTPATRTAFWAAKFAENVARDQRVVRELAQLGWRVCVVWECELERQTLDTVAVVAAWLQRGDPEAGLSGDLGLSRAELLQRAAQNAGDERRARVPAPDARAQGGKD